MILEACRSGILKLGNVCATHDFLREKFPQESTSNFFPPGKACAFHGTCLESNPGCTDLLEFATMMLCISEAERARTSGLWRGAEGVGDVLCDIPGLAPRAGFESSTYFTCSVIGGGRF